MSTQLYTVTLSDHATYRITVAADTPTDAESVAKTILLKEAPRPPDGLTILKREAEATAELATDQPIRRFEVTATYSLDFSITVPAVNAEEAERHAKRLYQHEPLPWEYATATGDERTRWHCAQEVVS